MTSGCQRNRPYDTSPSQRAGRLANACVNRPAGPNASGVSSMTATSVYSVSLAANWPTLGVFRSRGPARGVVATARVAKAIVQQVTGAWATSFRTRSSRGPVPVARATWAVASAIPAANHMPKDGSHDPCGELSSTPVPSRSSQLAVAPTPMRTVSAITRAGRHRPIRTIAASSGRTT